MRTASIERKTSETHISLKLNIDGEGVADVHSGMPFVDHMLESWAKHGLFDLQLNASGDLDVDFHHTVEDIGICLGKAILQALGDKKGIRRFGSGLAPMDNALTQVAIDISGRPFLHYHVPLTNTKVGEFDADLVKEFFEALVLNAQITLHIAKLNGDNAHHVIESVFKGFGIVLDTATSIDPRKKDIPSTKGVL